jgi:hypothetical protein
MKGTVIIDYERDEEREKCSYCLTQKSNNPMNSEDLISLFKHIIGELMDE